MKSKPDTDIRPADMNGNTTYNKKNYTAPNAKLLSVVEETSFDTGSDVDGPFRTNIIS